jgi:predicted alpha/beta-hydrolase family hydrolase
MKIPHLLMISPAKKNLKIYRCSNIQNLYIRRPRQTQGGARQGRRQASLAAPAARAGFLYFQYPPTPADSKGERVRAERL